jgi:hypothetical protein
MSWTFDDSDGPYICMRCFQQPCVCVIRMRRKMEKERMDGLAKSFLRDAQKQGMVDKLIIALTERGMLVPILAEAVAYGMQLGREELTHEIEHAHDPESQYSPAQRFVGMTDEPVSSTQVKEHAQRMFDFLGGDISGFVRFKQTDESPEPSGDRFAILETEP